MINLYHSWDIIVLKKHFPLHNFLCQMTCSALSLFFFGAFLRIHKQMFSARMNQAGLRLCVFLTIIFLWISSKLWVLFRNICKEKNLIRMMLKPVSRIQVKIYGCSIGDSIFLPAQLVSCKKLHSPLMLFDQENSVTQLRWVTGRVSTIYPIALESNGAGSSFVLNLDVPPMDVMSTLLSCPTVISLEVTQLQ